MFIEKQTTGKNLGLFILFIMLGQDNAWQKSYGQGIMLSLFILSDWNCPDCMRWNYEPHKIEVPMGWVCHGLPTFLGQLGWELREFKTVFVESYSAYSIATLFRPCCEVLRSRGSSDLCQAYFSARPWYLAEHAAAIVQVRARDWGTMTIAAVAASLFCIERTQNAFRLQSHPECGSNFTHKTSQNQSCIIVYCKISSGSYSL